MKAPRYISILIPLLLVLYSCSDPGEFALFEAQGIEDLPECMAEEFPFEPTLHSAPTRNDRVTIVLQSTPDVTARYDAVTFELYDVGDIDPEEPIELAGPSSPPPPARGKMVFFSSCEFEHESLDLMGTLYFDTFEPEANGVISGRLEDGYAVSARTGEVEIDDLTGSWRFVVRRGPPYEDFFAVPERP